MKKFVAKELMKIARELQAVDRRAFDEDEIRASAEALVKGVEDFKRKYEGLYDQIDELKAMEKDLANKRSFLEKELKGHYKDFSKNTGLDKVSKNFKIATNEAIVTKRMLYDIIAIFKTIDGAKIEDKISTQPAYKAFVNVLIALLNESEHKKYVQMLEGLFNKLIVDFDFGEKQFNITIKAFDEEVTKVYNEARLRWNERHPENPLPEIEKLASQKKYATGMLDYIKDFGGWVKKTFGKLADAFSSLASRLADYFSVSSKLNDKLDEVYAAAKKL